MISQFMDWNANEHRTLHDPLDPLVARISRAVRPLYAAENRRPPRHIGCGVLFRTASARFLLTAAHVVEEFLQFDMYLAGDASLVGVKGRGERASQLSAPNMEQDLLDIGVIRLEEAVGTEVDGSFLTLADVAIREWMSPQKHYLLYGYAATKTRLDTAERVVLRAPFRFVGSRAGLASHEAYGITPHSHVALDFDIQRTASDKGIGTAPSPKGVSGGGMWSLPDLGTPGIEHRAKLAAIFIAHPSRHRLLVGTRVCFHTELIREKWPEMAGCIPSYAGPAIRFHPTRPPTQSPLAG